MTTVRHVGRYETLRVLGRGAMATVYLVRQPDLDREVALKELTLAQGPDPAAARRFLREARLAGSFSHPNIVTVHEYFEEGGTPYIAMEYLERGALRAYVGRLSLEQVGGVLEDVLAGLAHAEERGIVHRDIKPENLMVTVQGRTKIADFGIAKATSAASQTTNLTVTGTSLGTPRYMAPERALGQEVGPWSDLYAVGVVAFELLVGRTPFHETQEPMAILMRQVNEPIPRVDTLVPDVDPALADWIERLLVKAPEDRTRAASTAWDELDEVLMDRLGPRWARAAPLPAQPGGETAALATRRRPKPRRKPGDDVRPHRAGAASSPEPESRPRRTPADTGKPDDAGTRRRARAGAQNAGGSGSADREDVASRRRARAASPGRTGKRSGASAAPPLDAAATLAPSTLRPVPSRAVRRRRLLWVLGAVIVLTIAAGRVLGAGGPAGTPGSTLDGLSPRAAERQADLSDAKTPAERTRAARALAGEYERDAGALGAGEHSLAARMRRVAKAYRTAAAAAAREDGSDYDDAIARARAGERAITRERDRGIGDSQSDDPSDDAPDGGED